MGPLGGLGEFHPQEAHSRFDISVVGCCHADTDSGDMGCSLVPTYGI